MAAAWIYLSLPCTPTPWRSIRGGKLIREIDRGRGRASFTLGFHGDTPVCVSVTDAATSQGSIAPHKADNSPSFPFRPHSPHFAPPYHTRCLLPPHSPCAAPPPFPLPPPPPSTDSLGFFRGRWPPLPPAVSSLAPPTRRLSPRRLGLETPAPLPSAHPATAAAAATVAALTLQAPGGRRVLPLAAAAVAAAGRGLPTATGAKTAEAAGFFLRFPLMPASRESSNKNKSRQQKNKTEKHCCNRLWCCAATRQDVSASRRENRLGCRTETP